MRTGSIGSTGFAVLRREANEGGYFRPIVKEVVEQCLTFGDRINFHVHLHFLVTEGGVDTAGVFHTIPGIDDARLAEIFAREALAMLIRKELLSPDWAERILSWPHSGFNVHSLVRAKTKPEAERVGKYMLRPILALERLTLLETDSSWTSFEGRDIFVDEVRLGFQADSERAPGSGRKRKLFPTNSRCRSLRDGQFSECRRRRRAQYPHHQEICG